MKSLEALNSREIEGATGFSSPGITRKAARLPSVTPVYFLSLKMISIASPAASKRPAIVGFEPVASLNDII